MSQLNALRLNLRNAAQSLDLNKNGTLATHEVSRSDLSKLEKKVLNQAISRAANSAGGQAVTNVQAWVDRFVDDFQAFDADGSGSLSEDEISRADPFRQQQQLRAMQKLLDATPRRQCGNEVLWS